MGDIPSLACGVALGATIGSAVLFPGSLPFAALIGARAYLATAAIQSNPVIGTAGLAASIAMEYLIPGSSSGKYLVQTGNSIHRVKDISQVAAGTKLLIQTGSSIHRVGQAAGYGFSMVGDGVRAATSLAAYLRPSS